jgi:hemoglobin/transferrin/lactoferrin receptor protein
MDVPSSVSVVTAEDLEEEPYTNIGDLLATLPGVVMNQALANGSRPGAPRISIRGEGYERTLFVINGIKVVDKDYADNNPLIDLSQVERIEVIKGPASVLYGSEAIGGVVNIITKKGGTKPFGFSQNVVYDSSTTSADIQSAIFGRWQGFNYRISGNGVNVHNRKTPKTLNEGSETVTSSYKNRYFAALLGYDWGNHSLTVQFDRYLNHSNYAQGVSADNMNTHMWLGPNNRTTYTANLILRELTPRLDKVTLIMSYQEAERDVISDFNYPAFAFMGMWSNGHNYSLQKQYTLSAQSEWNLGAHYLTAGLDFEMDDISAGVFTYPYNNPTPVLSHARVKQQSLALFAQDEWSLTDTFKATYGIRFNDVRGRYKHRDGIAFVNNPKEKQHDSHVVGSLGVVYRGISDLALRAQISQGYRYPTTRQLYTGSAGHGATASVTYPNPDLKPETSINYEVGARYLTDSWDVDFAVFLSQSKNFIQSIATSPTTNLFINGDKARTVGSELALSYAFRWNRTALTPYGNVTYLHRTLTLGTGPNRGRKTSGVNVPPFQGRLGLKLETPLSGNHMIFNDLYVDMASKANDSLQSATVIRQTPLKKEAWQTLNYTIGIRGGEDHKYHVSVSLRNILNQTYRTALEGSNVVEPAFHVVVGAGFEF